MDDTYNKNISIDDLFLIYFRTNDIIGHVIDINDIEKKITIEDDNDNKKITLEIDDNNKIILKTKKYEILDIEKIIEFDTSEFDEVTNSVLKQDIYPEIELETDDASYKNYEYTETEKREIILSELILSYNTDNPTHLKELLSDVNVLLNIINKTKYDYKTKNIINKNELSNWMIPVFDIKPKIYTDEELYKDLTDIERLTEGVNYKKFLSIIMNDNYEAYKSEETNNSGYVINHSGRYFTDCMNEGCIGNNGLYYIDDRKTINPIDMSTNVDKQRIMMNIIPKRSMNMISFITLPLKVANYYDNIKMNNRSLSLKEKIIYNKTRYTNLPFGKYISDNYENIIFKNMENQDFDLNNINVYNLTNKIYNKELFVDSLEKLPSIKDILETINIPIYNYNDIERLLFIYDIKIEDFTVEDIKYINNLIKYSIQDINKSANKFIPIKYEIKKIDIDERLLLIKEYIFKQTDINIRNYYLNQYIEKFTKSKINDNWLYTKHNNERDICKHHVLSSRMHYDKDIYSSLINLYGTEPTDGIIYCKNCGEYISEEKFSVVNEFDDVGIIVNEEIENDELDILDKLSNVELEIVERIKQISRSLSVELNDKDIYEIFSNYQLIKNDEFANKRYNNDLVSTTNHPIIVEANKQNLTKTKLKSIILNTQKYLIYSNQLIYLYIVTIIYIQTSIPEYTINEKDIKLIDFTNKSYEKLNTSDDDSSINMSMINNIIKIIKDYCKIYSYEDFWKYASLFIKEYENTKSTKPEIQIINAIKYIISPYYYKIIERINKYNKHKDTSSIGIIKKYWTTYNPNPNNKDINKINDKVKNNKNDKQYLIRKNISGYAIENIIDITSIDKLKIKYIQYSINNFYLLYNKSFRILSRYIVNLHGVQEKNEYINLLIHKFKKDTNTTNINTILKKYGYDNLNINKKVKFNNIKKMLYDINKLHKNDVLDIYNHIIFNNLQYTYLVTKPKRHYKYIFTNLYSDELVTDETKKKLKNKFCYNKYGRIIYNDKHIITSRFISFDNNIHLSNYHKSLNVDNIYSTIREIHIQTKLPINNSFKINQVENRIKSFIESNNIDKMNNNLEKIKELTTELLNPEGKKKNYETLYRGYYSSIIKETNDKLKDIIEFIEKSSQINKYLKSIKLEDIFKKILDDHDDFIKKSIYDTQMMTILISKNIDEKTKIPKYWMRNQYNSDLMSTFLKTKRYSMHNDIFIKSGDRVFKKYFEKADYFINLTNYISNITKNMDLLIGIDDSHFTKKYAKYIMKYIFVNYFYSYVDYIKNMSSLNTDIPNIDNVLYELLENNNKDRLEDSITTITSYFIDIITNMIQEYLDPQWINNKESTLSEKLSIQKEREKQSLIKKLDIMTPEERLLAVQKQNYGISNWYQAAAQENQDYIDSNEYKEATEQERLEIINEIQQSNSVETDVLGEYGLNKPDVRLHKPKKTDDADYDEYSFNDGDVEGNNDLDGFDRNTIDD
uniref:Uncharacterized protein n=1 Tax=viral metagenome TaxID=1070528 RepID=A0A6C0CX62_9ZZZZ